MTAILDFYRQAAEACLRVGQHRFHIVETADDAGARYLELVDPSVDHEGGDRGERHRRRQ